DLDTDEIIAEFTDGYYEEAGIYVKKYIDLVHTEIQKDTDYFLFLYGDPAQAFNSFLNPELLKQYNTFFNDAEKAVAHKPEALQRVKTARISTDYAMLEMARNGKSPDFQLLKNDEISENTKLRLTRFKESCQNANITLMNEMGYTVTEYLNLYNETLKRAAIPNIAIDKNVTLITKPKKYANENPQALTDGALGGSNFYSNYLGFEGNNLEAIIDLGKEMEFSSISTAFLQVTNHIVFFPKSVTYSYSNDQKIFTKLKEIANSKPLSKTSKKNDIEYFTGNFSSIKARFIKVEAKNIEKAPGWHNAAGLPAWIFVDEVIVN
ncbi:MAG: discoidin domain-containing protein, partial [Draconibacterium sp.]|nr:discoidin domain-containing protein [Draconibacterium sp.]